MAPAGILKIAGRATQMLRNNRSLRHRLGIFTIKSAIFYFRIASAIKALPFELCSKDRLQVKLHDQQWKRWLWYLVNMAVFVNSIFQVVSFVWNTHLHGMTDEAAFHVIYAVLAIVSILYFSNVFQKPHEFVMLINQIDFLIRISRSRHLGGKKWHNLPFCILSLNYLGFMALVLMAPVLVVVQIMDPEGPMNMTTLFGSNLRERYVSLYFAFLVMELAISYWKFAVIIVFFCVWNASVLQNIIWMDQLIANQSAAAANVLASTFQGNEQTQEGQIRTYRYVQILNVLHNDLFLDFSAGFTGVCIISMTGLLFVSLTAYHLLSIFMYLMFPAFAFFGAVLIVVFYAYLSSWQIKSSEFIELLKQENYSRSNEFGQRNERKVIQRDIKSLRAIRNKLAHFGYTCIAVSQGSIEEIFNELLLVLSF